MQIYDEQSKNGNYNITQTVNINVTQKQQREQRMTENIMIK